MDIPTEVVEGLSFAEEVQTQVETTAETQPRHINVEEEPVSEDLQTRIIQGLAVAMQYADRLPDGEFAKAVREKLCRSNVRGSRVDYVNSLEDVSTMLSEIEGWHIVESALEDKGIICVQGTLPPDYTAYAAYASIREICNKYGADGVRQIDVNVGKQREGDFFLSTLLKFPTDTVTVQLKKDQGNLEYLHQWFAGVELSSVYRMDDGDTIVRCGVVVPYVNGNRHGKRQRFGQGSSDKR